MRTPLVLWSGFVFVFASLSYTARFTEGRPPEDLLYKWSTVVGNLIQFAIIGGIAYAIAGLGNRRRLFATRPPTSWKRAAGIAFAIGLLMLVLVRVLGPVLEPGREQGVTPDRWQPDHAAEYLTNAIVIAVVAPIVEELTFRGLGYSLLVRYGRWVAIALVGIAFGLAHGLVDAFPFLAAFGAGLAYLRSSVDSVYPCIILHGLFNAIALTAAVVEEPETARAWSAFLFF